MVPQTKILYGEQSGGNNTRLYAKIPFLEACPHLSALWENAAARYLKTVSGQNNACAHLQYTVTEENGDRLSLLFEAVRYEDGVCVSYRAYGQIADISRDRLLPPAVLGLRFCRNAILRRGELCRVKNTFANPQKEAVRYSELQNSVRFVPARKKERKKSPHLLHGNKNRGKLTVQSPKKKALP